MAEVIKTIKSSGGDYTTVAAWEADISANPTDDQTASIEEAMDVGSFTINVANANAVTFKVTVAEAYRFYQQAGWPDMVTALTQGAHALGTDDVVYMATSNVVVEWLGIKGTGSANMVQNSSNGKLRHCLLYSTSGSQQLVRASNLVTGENCAFLGGDLSFWAQGSGDASGTFVNCSFNGARSLYNWSNGTITCYGCITNFWNQGSGSSAGDENVGVGTTVYYSTTGWDNQTNVYVSSTDLHLQEAKATSYPVTNRSATYPGTSADIDNETRAGQFYAGCDAIPQVGGATPTLLLMGVG